MRTLLGALFSRKQEPNAVVRLSDAKAGFDCVSGQIKEQIYAELVKRGYFTSSPEATRNRWHRFGISALAAVIISGIIGGFIVGGSAAFYWFAVAVAAVIAGALIRLSGALPQKTAAGAEATAKWRAFRTYLADLEKYEKVDEAKHVFDQFLAFVIAFLDSPSRGWRDLRRLGSRSPSGLAAVERARWAGTPSDRVGGEGRSSLAPVAHRSGTLLGGRWRNRPSRSAKSPGYE